MKIELINIGSALPHKDDRIYRYMNCNTFNYFLRDGLSFTRMSSWPDRYEIADFEFLQNVGRFRDDRREHEFFASCWTFERIGAGEIDSNFSLDLANQELKADGSAAMWENYCQQGGVRIATSIGKLLELVETIGSEADTVFCGEVKYCATKDYARLVSRTRVEESFFFKRIGFRHECEYRLVTHLRDIGADHTSFTIVDYLSFLDEILVFPLKGEEDNRCANNLHQRGVELASKPWNGTNSKNGSAFCRVSQLLGVASEEIGNVQYVSRER